MRPYSAPSARKSLPGKSPASSNAARPPAKTTSSVERHRDGLTGGLRLLHLWTTAQAPARAALAINFTLSLPSSAVYRRGLREYGMRVDEQNGIRPERPQSQY